MIEKASDFGSGPFFVDLSFIAFNGAFLAALIYFVRF